MTGLSKTMKTGVFLLNQIFLLFFPFTLQKPAPPPVTGVKTVNQTKTSITLLWTTISSNTMYILKYENNGQKEISIPSDDPGVTYTVSNLSAGINYAFTLITVFKDVNSTGFDFHIGTGESPVNFLKVVNKPHHNLHLIFCTYFYSLGFIQKSFISLVFLRFFQLFVCSSLISPSNGG